MTNVVQIPKDRFQIIDLLRGAALVAMAVYHFAWDLRFFDLIDTDIIRHPFWVWFARCIAASFLMLVGASLVLAMRNGLDRKSFLKRLIKIGGAALLVTTATYFATPQSYIFFGILHSIALGSVLALAFLRLPVVAVALSAAIILAMPLFIASPMFDQPFLRWVGLGTTLPFTNDYVPVLPWFGFILIGMVIGRLMLTRQSQRAPAQGASPDLPVFAGYLVKAGRHSLPIYLIHQPVLLAFVAGLSLILPTAGADRATLDFRISCADSCANAGNNETFCSRYCACAEDEIRKGDLWKPMMSAPLKPEQSARVATITQQCAASSRQ